MVVESRWWTAKVLVARGMKVKVVVGFGGHGGGAWGGPRGFGGAWVVREERGCPDLQDSEIKRVGWKKWPESAGVTRNSPEKMKMAGVGLPAG